jgi:23S rRNA pseudouridine1911/1915/1917 synthase
MDKPSRADVFVAARSGITRSAAQRLIEAGLVTRGGVPVKNNYLVLNENELSWSVPEPVNCEAVAEDIPLDIVYEDGGVIVINKPRGMVVHPAPGHHGGTLVSALLNHCGSTLSGINGVLRPGIVHRIDKDTSGLLVAAKNDAAHQALAAQLAAHTMERVYRAVCAGVIKQDALTISEPIGRHPVDRKKMAVVKSDRHKKRNAVTHVTVLERFKKFTLIEARLETGRTHQIRVHLSHIGHPLLGDTVYGSARQPFNTGGQILHAKTLGFTHPESGKWMLFDSALPEYFVKAVVAVSGM